MKYSIVISSQTGNTSMLGEKIQAEMDQQGNECIHVGTAEDTFTDEIEASDLIFVGFWTDKGTCDEKMAAFLEKLENKKVFLFGTAGFGGSDAYFTQIIGRVEEHINDTNTVVDSYMCQGKMPVSVKKRYEMLKQQNPDDKKFDEMLDNFEQALNHPNDMDWSKLATKISTLKI